LTKDNQNSILEDYVSQLLVENEKLKNDNYILNQCMMELSTPCEVEDEDEVENDIDDL